MDQLGFLLLRIGVISDSLDEFRLRTHVADDPPELPACLDKSLATALFYDIVNEGLGISGNLPIGYQAVSSHLNSLPL